VKINFKLKPWFASCEYFGSFVFLCIALALAGCSSLPIPGTQPQPPVSTLQLTNSASGPVMASVLQAQVMRFADTYVALVSQACDDISAGTTNPAVRLAALRWKLQQATAAYNDATGDNPSVNALDLLVLATMARNVVEDYGVATYGPASQQLLAAQREMEANAWNMAGRFLTPSQQTELKNLISEWQRKNPQQHDVGPIRFREFAAALGREPQQQAKIMPTSIFSLLYLNPLAGLDPTTAAIEGIRELGERAMYYSQRVPTLLNWQTQLLVLQVTEQPAPQQMLNNANQIAAAATVFSKTGEQLPQIINDQRQAAIQQILDGLVAQEDKTRGLVTDTRLTLNSAATAASNINNALLSLTAFVQYVSPTNTPATPPDTNSPPFNILDYGTVASQIGSTASNLTVLLITANQSGSQMEKLSEQFTDKAGRMMKQAFWFGLALIFAFWGAAVIAGLLYRLLANKLADRRRQSPAPKL
jgi:hypothetical protein